MNFLRKYFLHSPGHYAAALGVNLGFTLLVLFLRDFDRVLAYIEAFSVAGAISVLFGMLLWVSSAGAFNMFGYAFSYFRANRRYKDLYEYTVAKQEKVAKQPKVYVPYIVVGLVFLMISYIVSKSATNILV